MYIYIYIYGGVRLIGRGWVKVSKPLLLHRRFSYGSTAYKTAACLVGRLAHRFAFQFTFAQNHFLRQNDKV